MDPSLTVTTSTRGAIYIVTKNLQYVNLLSASVSRLKQLMPDLPVTVFSDLAVNGDFDVVRVRPSGVGFYDKARLMSESPYEQTIFIDTDIFAVEPFPELFTLLDRFDCALTHEEYLNTDWSNHYPRPDIPSSFPEFNTGIMVFRRSSEMRGLFAKWGELYQSFLVSNPEREVNDQPFFRVAAYYGHAKIATLGREYNCKFRGQGYLNGPVKFLHGHVKFQMPRAYMENVARLMNKSLKPRVYVGRTIYEQHITGRLWSLRKPRKIGSFPEPLPLWKLRAMKLRELLSRRLRRAG